MKNLKLTLILFMTFVLGVCSAQDATIEFVVDMNGVDQPSADYALVTVNGSWNGWTGFGAELFDADADGVYTGSLEIEAGTTFEYVVAVSGLLTVIVDGVFNGVTVVVMQMLSLQQEMLEQ